MGLPPASLIAGCVILRVMNGAQRDGELVTHFETQSSRLRIADVMRLRRTTARKSGMVGVRQSANALLSGAAWVRSESERACRFLSVVLHPRLAPPAGSGNDHLDAQRDLKV
jgi:hypothetical protein